MTVVAASTADQLKAGLPGSAASDQTNWGQIFAAIPYVVLVLDGKGIVVRANKIAFRLLNHELIGHLWHHIIGDIFQATRLDGSPLKLQDGRMVSLRTEPLMSGSGQLILIQELADEPQKRLKPTLAHSKPNQSHLKVVAEAPSSRALLQLAERVAQSEVTVMITGESGTGKEVIARFIHEQSQRAGKPFVAINCAAIPETMLEATLFGYEKGAFTGAVKANPGKFEQANGGTLLLDEISEMDLGLQAKLLRVLQEREVERLGSSKTTQLDIRILATSNRDMRQQVDEGKFREDLYYRLIVFPLHLQPLRDRPQDIEPMAQISLMRALKAMKISTKMGTKTLSPAAIGKLNSYRWPGNIRELDNVMQRAVILSLSDMINEQDIQFDGEFQSESHVDMAVQPVAKMPSQRELGHDMQQQEYLLIQKALVQGSRKAAAEKLAVSERTLRYKIAKLREAGFQFD